MFECTLSLTRGVLWGLLVADIGHGCLYWMGITSYIYPLLTKMWPVAQIIFWGGLRMSLENKCHVVFLVPLLSCSRKLVSFYIFMQLYPHSLPFWYLLGILLICKLIIFSYWIIIQAPFLAVCQVVYCVTGLFSIAAVVFLYTSNRGLMFCGVFVLFTLFWVLQGSMVKD